MARKRQQEIEDDGSPFDEQALVNSVGDGVSLGKIVEARDYLSTQCASLNTAIGRPGIPVGAITNIYGPEASGKSTLVYHLLAETQQRDGFAILYDSEGAYDKERGDRIGVDYDRVVMLEPTTLEDAFNDIEKIIRTVSVKKPDALITIAVDSVAGAPSKAVLEGEYGDSHPGATARAVSGALPRLAQDIRKTRTALILVGQTRAKIEFSPIPGASKETQLAEGAIRFWSHLRIRMQHAGEVGEKGTPSGIMTDAWMKKNKTAPPFRRVRFEIDFWNGINKTAAALDVAKNLGLVKLTGGWYNYGEQKFRAADFGPVLADNTELQEAIEAAPMAWMEGRE